MSADSERPIIIKRKKVVSGGGHHGGAWKVAYADFVTAMMAFFMLMWLLNATTEKQRKGLADYFNPSIPLSRVSGGGDGAMGGSSTFSQNELSQNGSGGLGSEPGVIQSAFGTAGTDQAQADAARAVEEEALNGAAEMLLGLGGDSLVEEMALKHVQSKLTDQGLILELFDLEDSPLFDPETGEATLMMATLTDMIARMSVMVVNPVSVEAHTRATPIVVAEDLSWDVSTARAHKTRELLVAAGLTNDRIQRVTGHANRSPVTAIPTEVRNNRVEVIFLRTAGVVR